MCRGIVAVFSCEEVTSQLFHVSNLQPRWRLSNHPEYPSVLRNLGIIDSSEPIKPINTVDSELPSTQSVVQGVELDVYNSLSVPKKTSQRYAKLHAMGSELATFGSSGDDHRYKIATLELTRLINQLKSPDIALSLSSQESNPAATFLPPVKRGGSLSKDTLANKFNKSSRKAPRSCTECVKVGLSGTGHISSSSDCPAKKQRTSNSLK